jgi:hypothetical protein
MNQKLTKAAWIILLAGAVLLLPGCAPVIVPSDSAQAQEPFRPPTAVSAFTNEAQDAGTPVPGEENEAEPRPAVTAACSNNLTFFSDQTIPDGTVVAPEATLDKRWEVHNSGSCNWGENYRVRLIAGSELGAQREQALFPARSDSRVTIRIVFKAPTEPGTYRSAWQAYNPQGEPFGDPFFIEVSVR